MHSYPLKFKAGTTPSDEPLTVLDAEKNEILFRPGITEDMRDGKRPCVITTGKNTGQPLYNILLQKVNETDVFMIRTTGNAILGKVSVEPRDTWKIMDEHDALVAIIRGKGAWKNSCLGMLLTLPMTDDWFWMKIISPRRFNVLINGEKVITIREMVSTVNDDYRLKKSGEFSERMEALLLVSLMMIL
jgi:hypothetical protein